MTTFSKDSIFKTKLQTKFLSENAVTPNRSSTHSAGFDLSSAENIILKVGQVAVVKTDLLIACPSGTYGRLAPRSGLTVKRFVDVGAGVVDADYRGPLCVVLINFGNKNFIIKQGDRIAQLILEMVSMTDAVKVEILEETKRGDCGFGSTGLDV